MNPGQDEQLIGVDLDPKRRPGTPRFRKPERWPNARWPIPQQQGEPSAALHGKVTPVFGTAVPLAGVSGAVRRLAYRISDHRASHWLLLLAGDRGQLWGRRLPMILAVAVPLAAFATIRASSTCRR